ncbi:uncharacterized protein LOC120251441 [Dioscorea cayenensis subsp. rotundata]|uniref:Uncharacterized protein LOC120251441 n=1 Tax=Dioscorea cayennensis subsp. rotundata TaxID=55577 RepID=A0AB40AMA7_DIOCR|nr:uncharacterized protein LOC120251441 [Dioscorea cayenensis subsp. rotundata]
MDPPISGRKFTWTNGQSNPIWVRLDRFLYSHDWDSLYPRSTQFDLPKFGSDHSPICLKFGTHFKRSRLFKFEKFWYTNPDITILVQDWWSELNPVGCGAFILSKKLAHLKSNLRTWSKNTFCASKILKCNLLYELHSIDIIGETRPLSEDESNRLSQIRSELYTILNQEEIYWKQRSRITWLREGDSNTKFFHNVANRRRNRNLIPRILQEDHWITGNEHIGRIFTNHYRSTFWHLVTK